MAPWDLHLSDRGVFIAPSLSMWGFPKDREPVKLIYHVVGITEFPRVFARVVCVNS